MAPGRRVEEAMKDFIKLVQVIRKIEVLLSPLLPRRWRTPPPSYRLFAPLLAYLGRREAKYPWAGAASLWLRENYLQAYHKGVLPIDELSPAGLNYIRAILLGMMVLVGLALLPSAPDLSFWVHGLTLLAVYGLAFHAAMQASISALWVTSGLLYVPVAVYSMVGTERWAPALLGVFGLILHARRLEDARPWRWFDVAATAPYLCFWLEPLGTSFLGTWTIWQRSLLVLSLWSGIWLVLFRARRGAFVAFAAQLFWPASHLAVVLMIWSGVARWSGPLPQPVTWIIWVILTLAIGLGFAKLAPRLRALTWFGRPWALVIVLTVHGGAVMFSGSREALAPVLANSVQYLFDHSWPVWFFLGASTILAFRGVADVNLSVIRAVLPTWFVPVVVWGLCIWAVATDRFTSDVIRLDQAQSIAVAVVFAAGATWLAWTLREDALKGWLFWGFFAYFIARGYWREAQSAVAAPEGTSAGAFLLLAAWALWLSYRSLSREVKRLAGRIPESAMVSLTGALLLFMICGLWLSHVDDGMAVRTQIAYHLFLGLTFLGIPQLIYATVLRHTGDAPAPRPPWGKMVLCGIVGVQLLHGVEHYVVGLSSYPSLDALHAQLREAFDAGSLDDAAPAAVTGLAWSLAWRVGRWLLALGLLTAWMLRDGARPRLEVMLTMVLVSLMVWVAETLWIDWPGVPYTWAVVLRPWRAGQLLWDLPFFAASMAYAAAGLAWGFVLARWRGNSGGLPP